MRTETRLFTTTQDLILDVSGNVNVALPVNSLEGQAAYQNAQAILYEKVRVKSLKWQFYANSFFKYGQLDMSIFFAIPMHK
jgi:hypothetical protein